MHSAQKRLPVTLRHPPYCQKFNNIPEAAAVATRLAVAACCSTILHMVTFGTLNEEI